MRDDNGRNGRCNGRGGKNGCCGQQKRKRDGSCKKGNVKKAAPEKKDDDKKDDKD